MTVSNAGILRKWGRTLTTGAGLLLFGFLLIRAGVDEIAAHIIRFGPWIPVLCGLAAAWLFAQACAWSIIQKAVARPVPLLELFRIKIISDTLNTLIPSGSFGGDAVRPFLIRRDVPLSRGIPGVLFDKTLEFSAGLIIMTTGFLVGLFSLKLPEWLFLPTLAALLLVLLGIVLFIVLQVKGVNKTLSVLSRVVPPLRRSRERLEAKLIPLDETFRLLYSPFRPRLLVAAGLHLFARILGVVEVFLILWVLGAKISFSQALFVAAFVTIFNTAFFLVPGHLGVMEGAHVLVIRILGYPAAVGLSLSVIRRIRKLVTVLAGLVLFALAKRRGSDGDKLP